MDTKFCKGCNTEKPVSAFGKRAKTLDGLYWCCKSCDSEKSADYYLRKKAGLPIGRGHPRKAITNIVEIGQRFGRGVIIELGVIISSEPGRRSARLLCDCGNKYEASLHDLLGAKGHPPNRSCGCYRREELAKTANLTLTQEQVDYVLELLDEGFDKNSIAYEIGFFPGYINFIKSGKYTPPEQ